MHRSTDPILVLWIDSGRHMFRLPSLEVTVYRLVASSVMPGSPSPAKGNRFDHVVTLECVV